MSETELIQNSDIQAKTYPRSFWRVFSWILVVILFPLYSLFFYDNTQFDGSDSAVSYFGLVLLILSPVIISIYYSDNRLMGPWAKYMDRVYASAALTAFVVVLVASIYVQLNYAEFRNQEFMTPEIVFGGGLFYYIPAVLVFVLIYNSIVYKVTKKFNR